LHFCDAKFLKLEIITGDKQIVDGTHGVHETSHHAASAGRRGSVDGEGVGLVGADLVLNAAVARGLADASHLTKF